MTTPIPPRPPSDLFDLSFEFAAPPMLVLVVAADGSLQGRMDDELVPRSAELLRLVGQHLTENADTFAAQMVSQL